MDPAAHAVASPAAAGLSATRNLVLQSLSPTALAGLLQHLEPVYLVRGTTLYEPGRTLSQVYFPRYGVVSLGYQSASGDLVEVAIVGREGVVGVEAFLGAEKTRHRAFVHTMCTAYALPMRIARSRFAEGGALQDALLRYVLRLMLHISQNSICKLHHSLEQRVCRYLLESMDRVESGTLAMTHDSLAGLAGGRRQGVTEVIGQLRDRGLVAGGRGCITVLDRAALLDGACECYAVLNGSP